MCYCVNFHLLAANGYAAVMQPVPAAATPLSHAPALCLVTAMPI